MVFWLGLFVGLIVAGLFLWNPWTTTGTLRIDHSNPEKDLYRLEIDELEDLSKRKRIILKVDNHADLSQNSPK